MLIAVDIGNSITEIGFFDGDRLLFTERMTTAFKQTDFEAARVISDIIELYAKTGNDTLIGDNIDGAVIASVVPDLTDVFRRAIKRLFGVRALAVGPGLKTGLHIRIDDPAQLGYDLAALAVGAAARYTSPLAIIDFGTATTIGLLDKNGSFIGGTLAPGVKISSEALTECAGALPNIGLGSPRHVIGKNTVDCLKSGIINGTAAMIDGLLDRFEEEMKTEFSAVATGSIAPMIIPHCKRSITVDEHLLMYGLYKIYSKN